MKKTARDLCHTACAGVAACLIACVGVLGLYAVRPVPRITFSLTTADAGTVIRGAPIKYSFRFANTGRSPLEIERVDANCQCSALVTPGTLIMPGGTGEIATSVNTTALSEGLVETRVATVRTNDSSRRAVTLIVRAKIESEFVLSSRAVEFDSHSATPRMSQELLIRTAPDRPGLRLLGVHSTDEGVSARLEPVLVDGLTEYRVVVVEKGTASRWHFGNIIVSTSSRHMPELRIPVRATELRSLEGPWAPKVVPDARH